MKKSFSVTLLALGLLLPGGRLHAQGRMPPIQASPWFIRIAGLGAFYHSSAEIATSGQLLPGASANVTDNATVTLDFGYSISDNVSALLMVGVPPRPLINGRGTVAALGQLGDVRYGPVILTGRYSVRESSSFRPYVGAGVAYAIILKNYDASVSHLDVHNHFGFALQTGAEFSVVPNWEIFADFKRLWLAVNAQGMLAGGVPVEAHVTLNPSLVSAGVKVRYH
jgi:outer membrane protein